MKPSKKPRILAVIPARGGSKGLPGKNIKPFLGHPLIALTIEFARACPEITRTIISTDSDEIAAIGRHYGGDVPFTRPSELARDDTSMWAVLKHTLSTVEQQTGEAYDFVLLLDPTTPCRLPRYIAEAFSSLCEKQEADGIIGVSEPEFSPMWHSVVEKNGWMSDLFKEASTIVRRQDVPTIYRINGSLYIWKAEFMRRCPGNWREEGHHLMYTTPNFASISIDTEDDFKLAEVIVKAGLFPLPWHV